MLCWRAARRGVNWCLKASNSDLIVPMLQRGNAAPDAPRPYPQPAPSAPDRSHAPAWEPSPGRSASVSHRCGVFTSAFRPDGESGEMHGHFPRHPPRPPQLHGPSGSLRCSVWRGCAQTRRYAPQTPRTSFSRQPCATRPCRRGIGFRALLWAFSKRSKLRSRTLSTSNS